MTAAETVQSKRKWSSLSSPLLLRVLSALVLIPIVIVAALHDVSWSLLLWTVAGVWVLNEWMRMPSCPGLYKTAISMSCALLLVSMVWLFLGTSYAFIILAVLVFGLFLWRKNKGTYATYCSLGLLYSAAVVFGPTLILKDPLWGPPLFFWLCIVVWSTDTCAYFVGKNVGGPKLCPSISPSKTWSGFVGGTVFATILATLFLVLQGIEIRAYHIGLATVVSLACHAGDLIESKIKRYFNVKDSGHLIPGHGGLMDRLDGFIFASTATCLMGLVGQGMTLAERVLKP